MTEKMPTTTDTSTSDKPHMDRALTFCNGNSQLSASSTFHLNIFEPCSLPARNVGLHQPNFSNSSVCGYRYRESNIQHHHSTLSEQIDDPDVQVLDEEDLVAFCHGIDTSNEEPRHTTFDLGDLRLRGDEVRIVESSPLSAIVNSFPNGAHVSEHIKQIEHEVTISNTRSQELRTVGVSGHVHSELYSTTAPAYVDVGNQVESFQSNAQPVDQWSTVSAPAQEHSSSPFWALSKSRSKRKGRNENTIGARGMVDESVRKGSIISMLRAKFQYGKDTTQHADSENVTIDSNGTPVSGTHTTMSTPSANTTRSTNRAKRWHWRRLFKRLHPRHSVQNGNKTETEERMSLSSPNGQSQEESFSEPTSSAPKYDRPQSSCTSNNSSRQGGLRKPSAMTRKPDYNRATMLMPAHMSNITSSMVTVGSAVIVENSNPPPHKIRNIVNDSSPNERTMNTESKAITTTKKTMKSVSPVFIGSQVVSESVMVNPNAVPSDPSAILQSVSDKSKHLSLPISPEERHGHEFQPGVPHSFCGSMQSINVSHGYVDREQRPRNVETQPNGSTLGLGVMPDRRCENRTAKIRSQRGRPRLSQEASSSRVRKNAGGGDVTASSADSGSDDNRRGKVFGPRLSLLLLEGLSSLELKNKSITSMVKNMRRIGNGGSMLTKDESNSDLQSPWGVQNDEADDSNTSSANPTPIEQFKMAFKIGTGTGGAKKKITVDENDDFCSIDTMVSTRQTQRNRNCSGAGNSEGDVHATDSVFEMSRDEFVDFITSPPGQNKRPKWTAAVGIKK